MKRTKLTKKILEECTVKKQDRTDIDNYEFSHDKLKFNIAVEASNKEEALQKLIGIEV